MHHITIREFFRILKMAATYWPYTGTQTDQIQSFAVLEKWSDINADNFGKSHTKKGSDFFYSRRWSELQYNPSEMEVEFPTLIAFEPTQSVVVDKGLYGSMAMTDYVVWLFILDQHKDVEDELNEDYLDVIDLYLKAEEQIKDLFYFIENEVIIASVGGGAKTVYVKGALDLAGTVYTEDTDSTQNMINTLQYINETINVERFDVSDRRLHGVRIIMTVRARCEDRATWSYIDVQDEVMYDYHSGPYPDSQAEALVELDDDTMIGLDDQILDPL